MILHSIISPYDIFCNMDEHFKLPEYRRIDGGTVEVENGRIKRLISTDPKMFLDSRYQPNNDVQSDMTCSKPSIMNRSCPH